MYKRQVLGSTISFDATDKQFFMRITGFDKHFKETVQLAGDFIRHVKADDKQIRQVINDAKVTEKAFFESSDNIANALLEKVKYGEQSRFLTKLSLSEVKKLKGKELLDAFVQVRQTECDLLYCGTLPVAQVRDCLLYTSCRTGCFGCHPNAGVQGYDTWLCGRYSAISQ